MCLGQFGRADEPRAENPVFVDERPGVAEALVRASDHLRGGNFEQAARTLQKALDEHADGVVASTDDANLFEPVRSRVHGLLLSDARLLETYRTLMSPGAEQMHDQGRLEELERTRFMTSRGLGAALSLARARAMSGQFGGASMTLVQTLAHPDRASQAAAVSDVARLIGRYTTDGLTRELLSQLAGGGPLPDVEPAVRVAEAAAFSVGKGSTFGLGDDVVSQPLGSGVFGDDSLPIQPHTWDGDDSALDRLPRFAREMRSWPAVGTRAVYFSDGKQVTALDRVSVRRLWSVNAADALKLPLDDSNRSFNGMRSTATNTQEEVVQPVLTAGDSLLVSVVGRDADSVSAEGVEHLAAFDASDGEIRWSVPLRSLDEQLTDAYSRGPLVSDGRVVVVHLLKRQNNKRLLASVLVGVDALTGRRVWTRVVGSEGVLPFYRNSVLTDSTVARNGVVYRFDRLGVFGAYSIADGRPLWVRRLGSKVMIEGSRPIEQWLVHQPVLTSAGIATLTPDKDELLLIDPLTGMLFARRPSDALRQPEYLVATETHLVGVGEQELASVRLDQVEHGEVSFSGRLGRPGIEKIRGRVTVAGDVLLVPDARGLSVINPAQPSAVMRRLPLDVPGTPLALPEGLLVIDDARAHMYCTWAVAAGHLRAQIGATPNDPGPAVELLLLAERAGKSVEVIPSARTALGALKAAESGPADARRERHADSRDALVAALVRAALRSANIAVDLPGATLDASDVDAALQLANEAAKAPGERVAVLLATGEVAESRSDWAGAAANYHKITTDAALSAAGAPGFRSATAAGSVATDRLARVVRAGGREAYGLFDGEFEGEVAGLGPDAAPAAMEALAARYPLARGLPDLWLRIAAAYKATTPQGPQGERARARALERGVQAAERSGDADAAVIGELNGSLVRNLMDRSLLPAAAEALSRARARFPGVALTSDGVALAADDIARTIEQTLAVSRRWPRVGAVRTDAAPQIIEGWTLMEPLIRPSAGGSPQFIVLHKGDERRSQVALFGLKPGQLVGEAAAGETAPLTERWFSDASSTPWTLVRSDIRGALFFVGDAAGGRLVRVDAELGKVAWQTEPFGSLFPADPPRRFGSPGAGLRVPIGGEPRLLGEIILATDDRTVCMVERAGRTAAIDADSGQTLWTARLPVTRIADAALSGGQLIAVGEHPQPQPDNKLDRIALFDARSGGQIALAAAPISSVRYIRTTSRGDLILGAGGTVVCVGAPDLETARAAWTLTGHPSANAWEAWLLDDRLFLLGEDRALWEVSAVHGTPPTKAIDVQGRLDARTGVAVWQAGDGTVAFATGRGVAIVNGKGDLQALDAVNSVDGSVSPAMSAGAVLLLTPPATRVNNLGMNDGNQPVTWSLHRVETPSGRLLSSTPVVVNGTPLRMAAMDGRVAISTTSGTVVIQAPADAR